MDPRTFDHVVAAAASRPSRRGALRLLVGGLCAGLLPVAASGGPRAARAQDSVFDVETGSDVADVLANPDVGPVLADLPDPALVTCRAAGVGCDSDFQCCPGTLCCFSGVSLDTRCTDVSGSGWVCPGDTPIPEGGCAAGLVDCADGRGCVDLASDEWNCGACGVSCGLNQYCASGSCVGLSCFNGTVDCGVGYCVNPQRDFNHCGACGHVCSEETVCVGGRCEGPRTGGGGGEAPHCDEEYKEPFGEPPIGRSTCEDFE